MADEGITAGDGAPTMTTELTVGQQMHTFSNVIYGHFFGRSQQPFGITLAEWRVLRCIIHHPTTSQGEIASSERLNAMSVSRAVAALRRKGLIEVESDPEDRRRSMLSATDLGIELGADVVDRERSVYEHVFTELPPQDLAQLAELLDRIDPMLQAALPAHPPARRDWATALEKNLS